MRRTSWNEGWFFRPKYNRFAESGASSEWTQVDLPHDAMLGTERTIEAVDGAASGFHHGGVWEYEKALTTTADHSGRTVILEFEGVYRSAAVYVNDQLATRWANGYTAFSVDITDFLEPMSENVIRVESRAHRDSRWYTGGGIIRPVNLVIAGPVRIGLDEPSTQTSIDSAGHGTLSVATAIENAGPSITSARLDTVVRAPDGTVVATDTFPITIGAASMSTGRSRLHLRAIERWSTAAPSLYSVELTLRHDDEVIDTAAAVFGFRTLDLDPVQGLRVNGAEVKLRGACIHHDNGVLGAATFARAEDRRVELLKQAGFNAIRSAHNPLSRAMLDACDRRGVYVMDEAFDTWTEAKVDFDYSIDFPHWWRRDIHAMVVKDRNHPSVIAYSIGNEIPEIASPRGALLAREIAEAVRAEDSTRYVTAGVNAALAVRAKRSAGTSQSGPAGSGVNAMMSRAGDHFNRLGASDEVTASTEESFAAVDIAGMNYMDARYETDRELFPNRVIVGSETFPTRIDRLWHLVQANSHVIGDFTWTGWDYLGEAGIGRSTYADHESAAFAGEFPWLAAWCGDIDILGQRRPASFFREIVFGIRHEPYLSVQSPSTFERERMSSPWSWSDSIASWSWRGHEGRPIRVEVYSDADEVELLLDGVPAGRRAAGAEHGYRAEFDVAYSPGEISAVNIRLGRRAESASLRSAGPAVAVEAIPDRTVLDAQPGAGDLAFVRVRLVDSRGETVTDEDRQVTVAVEGAGALQGMGSADPLTLESFRGPRCTTFQGTALAAIRPLGPGPISVRVESGDMPPVQVSLQSTNDLPARKIQP